MVKEETFVTMLDIYEISEFLIYGKMSLYSTCSNQTTSKLFVGKIDSHVIDYLKKNISKRKNIQYFVLCPIMKKNCYIQLKKFLIDYLIKSKRIAIYIDSLENLTKNLLLGTNI